MKRHLTLAGVFATLLTGAQAQAHVTEIRIDAVEPFADNASFGTAGPYVRIKGIAKGELDPKAPANSGIVDLDKAPRNVRGMVEYEVDIFILRPADPAKGNGILYYEVLNRGNKQLGTRLHDTGRADASFSTTPGRGNTPATPFCSSAATPSCGRVGTRIYLAARRG